MTAAIETAKLVGQRAAVSAPPAVMAEWAAALYHDVMWGNGTYLREGRLWCPSCKHDCPCQCCGDVWASELAVHAAPPQARQLPHIAGVEYRSSG